MPSCDFRGGSTRPRCVPGRGESDPAIPCTALYDGRGRRLAIYPAGARAAKTSSGRAALRAATRGRPATSGVTASAVGPIIETFVPFPAGGGLRVLLVALPRELIGQFAAGSLREAAGTRTGGAFVVDRSGRPVAAVGEGSRLPGVSEAVADAARGGRAGGHVGANRFVVRPVSGTGLLVALTAPEDELTAGLPAVGWPRLALGGFALALLIVFWLIARALGDARRVEGARREAERANEAKTRFLSHMSHELRQPLAAIMGFTELLEQGTAGAKERQWTGHIRQSGQHLLALTNELLDISHIEAGKMTLAVEPVDVRSTVGAVLSLAAPLAAERGIRLEPPAGAASDRPALADPLRLKQVLLNLISNAIKYNREAGGVGVSIDETRRGTVRVAVTDTGDGIPRDALEKLFSPFERLGAERGPVAGSGLGLVVTKGLVEAMNGRLEVESEVGRGTTFAFELPAEDAEADRKERPPIPTPVASHAIVGDVLYIEDEPANLRFVESILADLRPGIELRTATEGAAGAALAEQRRPDLLLLDLNLPDMTGEEVLRRLRARPKTADLPILVLSGDSTARNVTRLLETGADAYLTKPLDVPQFLDVVDRLLSSR